MANRSSKGEVFDLDDSTVASIQEQLNGVNHSLSDLRERFAKIESTITHKGSQAERFEEILDQLELLLYGKGAENSSHESLISRVKNLEETKRSFKGVLVGAWAFIVALVLNFIHGVWKD